MNLVQGSLFDETDYFDPLSYDHYIVFFSGGKDSLACLLHLLELGIDKDKIELWHHEIDGREGSTLMDWPITPGYCQAVAQAIDVSIYFSWKVGGFEREMNRAGSPTAPTRFETPDGVLEIGGQGPDGTRRKFPQVSGDLRVRWCSAYLKIDVGRSAIVNQDRFKGKRTLVISGERAEESPRRAKYKTYEKENHKAGRVVDRWRPIHGWDEATVWGLIKKYRINPHPAYHLGWGRCSCLHCIFGNANQFASSRKLDPTGFGRIAFYEGDFGCTIKRKENIVSLAGKGIPYQMDPKWMKIAMGKSFDEPVFVDDWQLPLGAFGESCGPT